MKKQESTENYLETILILKDTLGMVRSIDIVNELGFSKPSVSVAMKHLREKGFITVDAEGYITLTDEGQKIASSIYERHLVLTKVMVAIGVSEKTAREDACMVEHYISNETFGKIKAYFEKSL